jgi:hypothetical protein
MDISNENKQSHVDPYEGYVVNSGIKGSSDVTTCSRLSESFGGLEHSAAGNASLSQSGPRLVTNVTGRSVVINFRVALTDPLRHKRIRRPQ